MSRQDSCPVCQADDRAWRALPRYRHAHLHRCLRCGHVFADSYPSREQLEQHYGGYPRRPCSSEITLRRYDELLDAFEPRRKLGRLLDVGCGVGDFLLSARGRGWEVDGVELEDRARALCAERGLRVGPAPLSPEQFAPGSFDVVTSFEVLEHMVSPRPEIHTIARLIRRGGLLYLTTPNFGALSRRLLGPRYRIIAYPEHLGYFRTATLDRLLRDAGLERVELRTTGFSAGHVYATLRSRHATIGGRAASGKSVDESVRRALEGGRTMQWVKRGVNRGLSELSLGDTLKASYRLR
jgi:2-polyprenyl-3-methyl-5-hydroxy-6-metoxy-1,4-benzoquinol methylase